MHTPSCCDVVALWSGIVDEIEANGSQPSVVVTAAAATPDRVAYDRNVANIDKSKHFRNCNVYSPQTCVLFLQDRNSR